MTFDYSALHTAQRPHPAVPCVPLHVLSAMAPAAAVDLVNQRHLLLDQMAADRLRFTYRPPAWREIDLRVARKRLEHPGACIELFVLGGHDSGKTDGAVCVLARHFFYTPQAWVWGLHSTQTSSKTIHQARVWDFFPPELRRKTKGSGGMKRDVNTKMKYGAGQGFTNDQFNLTWGVKLPWAKAVQSCGGLAEFKFFASNVDNLQGAKISCANSDELVDKRVARTVRQRMIPRAGQTSAPEHMEVIRRAVEILESGRSLPAEYYGPLYHGVHIMGFTPMQGYSPLVAAALDGAMDLQEEPACITVDGSMPVPDSFPTETLPDGRKRVYLLPVMGPNGTLKGCLNAPRFKQPVRSTQLVAYLWTSDNPWTNLPGKLTDLAGQNENEIRITFFGDVRKNWENKFNRFIPKRAPEGHLCTKEQIPREGSWYHHADFANGRNWFQIWTLVDPSGRKWVVREWPQAGDYITANDIGDPGHWATSEPPDDVVTGEKMKRDGYASTAQKDFGFGYVDMKREIARVEREIGEWWSADGSPIQIEGREGDSRLGNTPTPTANGSTSIIDEMNALDVDFVPASGKCLADGDQMIKDALAWDAGKPMGPSNHPKLMLCEDCAALRFMFSVYTGLDGAKGATKDPRDSLAMMLLGEPEYVGDGHFITTHHHKPKR